MTNLTIGIIAQSDRHPRVTGDERRFGRHRIAGTVTIEGEPGRRRVRVVERRSGIVVASAISAADGTYEVTHIPGGEYLVYALDGTRTYNAAVADLVVAVPMDE